eukprot:403365125
MIQRIEEETSKKALQMLLDEGSTMRFQSYRAIISQAYLQTINSIQKSKERLNDNELKNDKSSNNNIISNTQIQHSQPQQLNNKFEEEKLLEDQGSQEKVKVEYGGIKPSCQDLNNLEFIQPSQSTFSTSQWKKLENIYALILNQETEDERQQIRQSIRNKLSDLIEILEAINLTNQVIVKSKPKFEPNSVYSDARRQSNRGSQFRGVSRNGKKWQVMIMGKSKKQYIGAIEDESEAALIYDWHAVVTQGIRAKTNFSYTRDQLMKIAEAFQYLQKYESQFLSARNQYQQHQ